MQIEFKNVNYSYPKSAAPALQSISFGIESGEFVAVIGTSGSGKSTLCRLLLGLCEQQQGDILINGKSKEENRLFKGVGMVFQYPEQQLFAETVFEEVSFALKCHGVPEAKFGKAVHKALCEVGLDPEKFCSRNPFMLSGGEKRRVAIASVLVMEPQILILDEPSAGVDLRGRAFITELAKKKNAEGVTVIWVTHQMEEAAELSDKILVLNKGELLCQGAPSAVFNNDNIFKAGLDLPEAARLMRVLKQHNADIKGEAVTIDAAIGEIKAWKTGGAVFK